VHVVAKNNNVAAQLKLKLTSHLEADVPASEAGVSDVARTKAPELSLVVLALKFAYAVSEADLISMPDDDSTSSHERIVDIYHISVANVNL
jgi:hypothetical protein